MSLSETSWEIVVLNISGKPQKLTCDSVQCSKNHDVLL